MNKIFRFKKEVFSNLEPEGQEPGIIKGVTRLLLLGPFYTILTNFMYFFAHNCRYMTLVCFLSISKAHYRICFCNGSLMKKKKEPKSMPGNCLSAVGAFKGALVILYYFPT